MRTLRLLVLAIGTQVGQNIVATLAGRRQHVVLMGTSSVANEPALFDCDAVFLVPQTAHDCEAFERALLEIVERERIDLVVPCRDDDVVFVSQLRDRRPDLGPRLLCGSGLAARVIGDKWLSYRFAVEHGLPFVPSMIRGSHEPASFIRDHGLPLLAKPRRGYASMHVRLLFKESQVAAALAHEDGIVQELLGDRRRVSAFLDDMEANGLPLFHSFQGLKHSIQALIAPDGAIAHVICTRNALYMRRSKRVERDDDSMAPEIGRRCAVAFASAGWRGPLNIQCERARDGQLRIHEFNGRFTGGTIDRWLLGLDEVGVAIAQFTGRPMPAEREPVPATLEVLESLVARAADPEKVEMLARDRVWRRTA